MSRLGSAVATPPHQIGEHGDEVGMVVQGGGAVQREAPRLGQAPRLDVEVVQHLDVIAHEADRHDNGVAVAVGGPPPPHGGGGPPRPPPPPGSPPAPLMESPTPGGPEPPRS